MTKPSIPKGTRDFAADTLRKRLYITDTIRECFERYGFEPLETPAMEQIDTLMGKYGEEGDKLIFKILNNGLEHPGKIEKARESFEDVLSGKYNKYITERALRYDLTIPFARFVAMNQGQIPMPYKRYQIQPVWRADRPQRGRYREFYQCDADVAGTYSLLSDAEFALLYLEVFSKLHVPVEVKLNNRKILYGLAEVCGHLEAFQTITIAIDKIDKIGIEEVKKELETQSINAEAIKLIEKFLNLQGTNVEIIAQLRNLLKESEQGIKGVAELEELLKIVEAEKLPDLKIDCTLARGLNYYTGTIYEVKAQGTEMGSLGGGGRYNDLTGLFGLSGIPGVGISFGVDRIYDVMDELGLFPSDIAQGIGAIFFNLGKEESLYAFKLMAQCRQAGISATIYYEQAKLDKQFKYASKKNIPLAIIAGSREMKENSCMVKDIRTGDQEKVTSAALPEYLKRKLILPNQLEP